MTSRSRQPLGRAPDAKVLLRTVLLSPICLVDAWKTTIPGLFIHVDLQTEKWSTSLSCGMKFGGVFETAEDARDAVRDLKRSMEENGLRADLDLPRDALKRSGTLRKIYSAWREKHG